MEGVARVCPVVDDREAIDRDALRHRLIAHSDCEPRSGTLIFSPVFQGGVPMGQRNSQSRQRRLKRTRDEFEVLNSVVADATRMFLSLRLPRP